MDTKAIKPLKMAVTIAITFIVLASHTWEAKAEEQHDETSYETSNKGEKTIQVYMHSSLWTGPILSMVLLNNHQTAHQGIVPVEMSVKKQIQEKSDDEKKYERQLTAVKKYLERAEKSGSGEDAYLAETLIEKVKVTDKPALLERLSSISLTRHKNTPKEVKNTEKTLSLAEETRDIAHIQLAQERVNGLFLSKEKTDFVERLHVVMNETLRKAEQR